MTVIGITVTGQKTPDRNESGDLCDGGYTENSVGQSDSHVLIFPEYVLPNIIAENGKISAFIDLGKMGPADRWQDLAIVLRSLRHNLDRARGSEKRTRTLNRGCCWTGWGIPMNDEKPILYVAG